MESTIEKQPGVTGAEHLRGYRWVKGQSGNPLGRRTNKQRIAERDVLADEFAAPTPVERLLLEQAARLLVRAENAMDADIAVRAFGAVRRLLANLRARRDVDAPPRAAPLPWSPIRERVGLCEPVKEPR
jgi:hypothetical protein